MVLFQDSLNNYQVFKGLSTNELTLRMRFRSILDQNNQEEEGNFRII